MIRITRHCCETGKSVAVVCHGVEIAAAAGVRKGRRITIVAKCALNINQFGGGNVNEPCVVDGNLESARTWNDKTGLVQEFLKVLCGA
ncbi:MAG: DJ-1/PfpI family protein [Planctomycetaceae bacterium]